MSNTYNVGWLRDNENQIFIPFTYTKSVKLDDNGHTLDSTVTTVEEHTDKIGKIEEAIQKIENGTTHVGVADSTKGTLTVGNSTFNGSTDVTVTAKDLGITGALVYVGISTLEITDGGTENPYINDTSVPTSDLEPGNIVLYKNINAKIYQEFLWTGDHWELLGDEGSYALKTISINAGPGLEGGGTLEAEREIKVNPDGITIIINADNKVAMPVQENLTAGSYGQADEITDLQPSGTNGTTTFNVPYITVDQYGRVTSASTKEIQVVTDTGLSDSISTLENRQIIAGAGLTGGGNLTDSRTLNVGEGAGITVEENKVSLTPSGVTSGSYGADVGDTAYHLTFNEELKIPYITVDQYGRITKATTETVKMPDNTEINDLLTTIIQDIAGEDDKVDNIVPRLAQVETRTKYLNASTEDGVFQITDKDGNVGFQVDNNGASSFDFILVKSEEESISLTKKLEELDTKDTQLGDAITDLDTNLNDKIDKVNEDLTQLINDKEESLQGTIENTASTINTTIENLEKSLTEKDTALQDSITALSGREIVAGKGLTGGGTLEASRTLDIGAGDGIQVNDDNIQLATSGVKEGNYGQSTEYTTGFDGSFTVPYIKVDQYGRITEATSTTIKMPSDDSILDKITDLENNRALKTELEAVQENLQSQIDLNKTNISSNDTDIEALQEKTAEHDSAIVAINDINTQQNDNIGTLQNDVIILDTRTKYMNASAPDEFYITDEQGYPGFLVGVDGVAKAIDFETSPAGVSLNGLKTALDEEIDDRLADQTEINDILSKMNITAGSASNPVYFLNGIPVECTGTTVPTGGSSGQVLIKDSSGNSVWQELVALPKGGTAGQLLVKSSATDGDASWVTTTVSNTLTAGTTAGPTIKTTVNGVTGTAVAIPSASSSASGIVTTGDQTFAGNKTIGGQLIVKGGVTAIYRSTSIENNYPATLNFQVYQTDNAITNTSASIKVYDDHDTNNYGTTMVIQSGGNMIIGSGEAPNACYTNDLADSAGENTYVVSDNNIYFYTNCNTYANKKSSVYINTSGALYGAVWNDYAEYRTQKETIEPGYCVASADNGQVYKTTEKFQACDGIVSDTFGFAIGQTDECKTPLAVAGRVLAYCEGDRHDYHAGDTVCAGPEGRVCKMTREEIREWPDRIIGIVSEIPEYETWGSGNIKVNNRIWIKIK